MLFNRTTTARAMLGQIRLAVEGDRQDNARRLFDRHEVHPPEWLEPVDSLHAAHRDLELLLRQGQIVWAHVVQANSMLFEKGADDHPAAILYGADSSLDGRIGTFEAVAEAIFDLKGRGYGFTDPEVQKFADVLTNEVARMMHTRVPSAIATANIFYTSILVHRKFLPGRRLVLSWFPILVLPDQTEGSLIVSHKYWPKELRRLWKTLAE